MTRLEITGCLQTLQGFCNQPATEGHDLQGAEQGQVDGLDPQVSMAQQRERLRCPGRKGGRPLQGQADTVVAACTRLGSLSMQKHSQHRACVMQTDRLRQSKVAVPSRLSHRCPLLGKPLQKACRSKREGPC